MRKLLTRTTPRVGLLTRFALASFVAVALLGVALAHTLAAGVRSRALADAEHTAAIVDGSLVGPQLTRQDLAQGLPPRRVSALDRALAASLKSNQIARIKIWNDDKRVIYATDHSIIGKRFPSADNELQDALETGKPASDVDNLKKAENAGDRRFGSLLEVYTPLRFGSGDKPLGAFELYLPYRSIAAGISQDTRRLYLFLFAGLTLLYLLLFRIVAGASTRLRRQAAENAHLALHDTLTDLPNRSLFHDRAQQAILAAKRDGTGVALMILDLDRFKEVNDTLGHHNGDLLLQEIGTRLRAGLRVSDTVARLGGDEFGLLLPQVSQAEAKSLGEHVRRLLREPFTLEGVTLDAEACVGIALYPAHGDDVDTLLQRADVAMYFAKADRSGCELYVAERDEYSPHRLALAAELRRALDDRELVLHYQPKAELASGRIVGVEALVRWQHPVQGVLGPDQFIPLAEATGSIRELTQYVLDEALRQQRTWRDAGIDIRVAVNLSARDLHELTLPETTARLLATHGVPPSSLELEITESVIVADPMRARAILSRLSEMGIVLAIDDYGTGYSSLGYLKRLPIDQMKIDRSFVTHMPDDRNDAAIVRSTIELGRNLGLEVVAEGVETAAAWALLKALGCDFAQGYYLSKPVAADRVPALVGAGATAPASAAGA